MVVTVRSLGLTGIRGSEVTVECFLSGGLPAFDVVGLPDAAVRESRERVRAAIKACGARFPVSRITVNLAPADPAGDPDGGRGAQAPAGGRGLSRGAEPYGGAAPGDGRAADGAVRAAAGSEVPLCPGGERRRGDARGRAHGLPG